MSKGGRGTAQNVLLLKKSEDRRQEALKVGWKWSSKNAFDCVFNLFFPNCQLLKSFPQLYASFSFCRIPELIRMKYFQLKEAAVAESEDTQVW